MDAKPILCRIDALPRTRTLEYVALASPFPELGAPSWPRAPGAVHYDERRRAALLHFSPARWLAPDPSAETRALLTGTACAAVGVLMDVSGKWDALLIQGSGARRLLACTLEVEGVLSARSCAAVTLFDCPAILARTADGYAVWVQSSYTTDFLSTARRFRAAPEDAP